jgi:hypothetical protein
MRSFAILLLCCAIPVSASIAASIPAEHALSDKVSTELEVQQRNQQQTQFQRAHSDLTGIVRFDLQAAGVAHMRQMKIVEQIGPAQAQTSPSH